MEAPAVTGGGPERPADALGLTPAQIVAAFDALVPHSPHGLGFPPAGDWFGPDQEPAPADLVLSAALLAVEHHQGTLPGTETTGDDLACKVARAPYPSPEVCDLLVLRDWERPLFSLARNPSCPQEYLLGLSHHPDPLLRRAVAHNPSCPPRRRTDMFLEDTELPLLPTMLGPAGDGGTTDVWLATVPADHAAALVELVVSGKVLRPHLAWVFRLAETHCPLADQATVLALLVEDQGLEDDWVGPGTDAALLLGWPPWGATRAALATHLRDLARSGTPVGPVSEAVLDRRFTVELAGHWSSAPRRVLARADTSDVDPDAALTVISAPAVDLGSGVAAVLFAAACRSHDPATVFTDLCRRAAYRDDPDPVGQALRGVVALVASIWPDLAAGLDPATTLFKLLGIVAPWNAWRVLSPAVDRHGPEVLLCAPAVLFPKIAAEEPFAPWVADQVAARGVPLELVQALAVSSDGTVLDVLDTAAAAT